jgi:hypothetical protein
LLVDYVATSRKVLAMIEENNSDPAP